MYTVYESTNALINLHSVYGNSNKTATHEIAAVDCDTFGLSYKNAIQIQQIVA